MTLMAVIPASGSWLWTQVSSCWNNLTALSISLILLALLLDYVKGRQRCRRCPPGPAPLPFIGNLLMLDPRKPQELVVHLEKAFGPASFFQAGWTNYILLNGYKIIKEALGQKAENFVDRPPVPLVKQMRHGKNCGGILFARCCEGWKDQRRFLVSTLKTLARRNRMIEEKVTEEAEYLCSELKSKEGSFFDPRNLTIRAVSNIVCILTFGDRFEYSDMTFMKLMNLTEEFVKGLTRILPQLLAAGSWLFYLPGPHRKVQECYEEIGVMISEIANEHKKTRDPSFPRDIIDAYLEEIEKAKGNPESSFNGENLINMIFDMFVAATETTAISVLWGLLILGNYPDIQRRVHEEMDKVVGRAKCPVMGDQQNLPYTNAVIHEIQRFADIMPVMLPFMTHHNTEVGKFVIPKETAVFYNLSSVLKDETMWEKPHEFYPEHFLDAEGHFVKREAFLPFSLGRHACPGEQVAKTILFIFFTSLLQRFSICMPENCPRPNKENMSFALLVNPPPFQICAVPR